MMARFSLGHTKSETPLHFVGEQERAEKLDKPTGFHTAIRGQGLHISLRFVVNNSAARMPCNAIMHARAVIGLLFCVWTLLR